MKEKIYKFISHKLFKISDSLARTARNMRFDLQKIKQCGYCGFPLFPDTYTIDHIKPRTAGGGETPDNLIVCCKQCNLSKGPYHIDVFRKKCLPPQYKGFFFETGAPCKINYRKGYKTATILYKMKNL